MANLKDLLEPGERILAQDPEAFVMWSMRVCAAALAGAIVWFALDGAAMLALFWAGAAALLILPGVLRRSGRLYRWQAVVTDRRLIYRAAGEQGHVSAPLAEIEIIQERDPQETLADRSEEARKLVKLIGKYRIRDGKGRSIGIRHDDESFYFETGKLKSQRPRELVTRAQEATP